VTVSLIHLDFTLIDMFRGSTAMPAAMLGKAPLRLPIMCGFFDLSDHLVSTVDPENDGIRGRVAIKAMRYRTWECERIVFVDTVSLVQRAEQQPGRPNQNLPTQCRRTKRMRGVVGEVRSNMDVEGS
jgi:hypothetical protein